MEHLVQVAFQNANFAQWIFIFLILLAGINVPISIDIVLISAGALTSTWLPSESIALFAWLFLACWVSAWEAYWLGRVFGPSLYEVRWFRHVLNPAKIECLHRYYEKFGFFTFVVGRFIPGGVRNALFMTSGLGKMPFWKFILRDFPACFASVLTLFSLGYFFGLNYKVIVHYIKTYNTIVLLLIACVVVSFLLYLWKKKAGKNLYPS